MKLPVKAPGFASHIFPRSRLCHETGPLDGNVYVNHATRRFWVFKIMIISSRRYSADYWIDDRGRIRMYSSTTIVFLQRRLFITPRMISYFYLRSKSRHRQPSNQHAQPFTIFSAGYRSITSKTEDFTFFQRPPASSDSYSAAALQYHVAFNPQVTR